MPWLEQVFGVSSQPVLSYVEREDVDARFRAALASEHQIIVYGSSKQGKTALVSKHLPYDENILVSLTPKTTLVDVYSTILSKAGIRILVSHSDRSGTEKSLTLGAKLKAAIPLFTGAEGSAAGTMAATTDSEQRFEEVPVNLELPQNISDLLARVGNRKWVILENFHYLTDETQKQFAFDLRAFQELGVRFVILGVWREKNRMAQFNGDLLDRVVEVPVEPWSVDDFKRVFKQGAKLLNIDFTDKLLNAALEASFSSIGVFQELVKGVCLQAEITSTQAVPLVVGDLELLNEAIAQKAQDYSARHQRALEAIAAGHPTGGPKDDKTPLYLPYYLVRVVLEAGYSGIATGMRRADIHDRIRAIHHRGADVRSSDMTNLLTGLGNLQSVKSISPPIIDYDYQNRVLQVVDSTFYFFIKNIDTAEALDSIQNPLPES